MFKGIKWIGNKELKNVGLMYTKDVISLFMVDLSLPLVQW